MINTSQHRKNRTCKFALESFRVWSIKTTSGCPEAYPVMGGNEQGSFYAVEKQACKNCQAYVCDEAKNEAYKAVKRKRDEKYLKKNRTTKYTW